MKKLLFVSILCLLLLTACDWRSTPTETTAPATVETTLPPATEPITEATTEATTESTTESTTEPVTEPAETAPLHSPLYIPGLSVEDVILYFNEVCLDAEFVNGGDATRLQRWESTIYYQLYGDYTEEDLAVLTNFTAWLNTIEGFPGMEETQDPMLTNLRIHFCTQDEMIALLGDNFSYMDAGVTFWYMNDEIYDAIICYRTDLNQYLRNSVILEEIYNGLGPVQDTELRPDSIIYSYYSEPQNLTEIDELLLKLLYHPRMQCGMTAAECETVIRELYY